MTGEIYVLKDRKKKMIPRACWISNLKLICNSFIAADYNIVTYGKTQAQLTVKTRRQGDKIAINHA